MNKRQVEINDGNFIRQNDNGSEQRDSENNKAAIREQRAKNLVAMGLVTRADDRFRVKTAAMRGKEQIFEVWRDEAKQVRCSCHEFAEGSTDNPAFRCEHILAVKHFLTAETSGNEHSPEERKRSNGPETPVSGEIMRENSRTEREAPEEETEDPDLSPPVEREEGPSPSQVRPMSFANILGILRQPIDPRLVKTREGWTEPDGRTHVIEYVEWHTVADILDRITPGWSHSVSSITQIGELVAVVASITIEGVTREGVGVGSAENETGIKKAEHDALKRAAVKFGIARGLYQRESEWSEAEGASEVSSGAPRDPLAKTLADLITPKQLGMIRALCRELGCDAEQECQALLHCGTEGLSKRAASNFIDHLKRKQQETDSENNNGLRQVS
jgi:hypothetical protein